MRHRTAMLVNISSVEQLLFSLVFFNAASMNLLKVDGGAGF